MAELSPEPKGKFLPPIEASLAEAGWRRIGLEGHVGEYPVHTPLFTVYRNLLPTVLSLEPQ